MRAEELAQKGAIYFERIQKGLSEYRSESLHMDEKQAYERLKEEWERNGRENCFADFYYFYLEEESQEIVRANLSKEECAYLAAMPAGSDAQDVIFPMDEMLLKIITKLNAREVLFSTVYFLKEPSTWWGNYKEEYIVFRR